MKNIINRPANALRPLADGAIKRGRAIVLALFVMLGVAHSFSLPAFEGIDEGKHLIFIHDIVETRGLPSQIGYDFYRSHEASQTPLYYLLGALLVSGIDLSDLESIYFLGPVTGLPVQYDHASDEMTFPPAGTILALRVLRLYSLAWGAVLLWFIGATLKEAGFREYAAVIGMAIIGLNPRFIHNAATITNDVAVTCMGAAMLWLLARRRPGSGLRWAWAAGSVCAVAFLCKLNGLVLLPVAAFALALGAWNAPEVRSARSASPGRVALQKALRRFVRDGLHLLVAFTLIITPYLLVNMAQYGQLLAIDQIARANATDARHTPLGLWEAAGAFPTAVSHLWVDLGASAPFGGIVRWMWGLLLAAAAIGAIGVTRALSGRQPWVFALWIQVALSLIVWVPWVFLFDVGVDQPRLWGVGLAALYIGLGLGASSLFERCAVRLGRPAAALSLALGIGALSLVSASVIPDTILPMYRQRPALVTAKQVAAWGNKGAVAWDNGLETVHVELDSNRARPGSSVTLRVAARATRHISEAHQISLEIRGLDGALINRWTGELLDGWPTTKWSTGATYSGSISIDVPATASGVVDLVVGWRAYEAPNRIARRTDSPGVTAEVARFRVTGNAITPTVPENTSKLDTVASLTRVTRIGDTATAEWLVLQATRADLTFFLHGLDGGGHLIAQHDVTPAPGSAYWEPGDVVEIVFEAPGLAQAQVIAIGAYLPESGTRRPAFMPSGARWPDDLIRLENPGR